MTVFVALLRAVNVGGTAVLPMKDLRALCHTIGLLHVQTYIQTGNVIFVSDQTERPLHDLLETAHSTRLGKPASVVIRTADQLQAVTTANPFPDVMPSRVGVVFLPEAPARGAMTDGPAPGGETMRLIGREVFIHYPNGMGRSKLKLPQTAAAGTMRNINTVSKLAGLAASVPGG